MMVLATNANLFSSLTIKLKEHVYTRNVSSMRSLDTVVSVNVVQIMRLLARHSNVSRRHVLKLMRFLVLMVHVSNVRITKFPL